MIGHAAVMIENFAPGAIGRLGLSHDGVDGRPTRVTSSPVLGEHNGQVLREWLGLSAQAVAALKADGAL